jgi:hypothetical protein
LTNTTIDFIPPGNATDKVNIWLNVYAESSHTYIVILRIQKSIIKQAYVSTYTETKITEDDNSELSKQLKKVIEQSTKQFESIRGKAVYSEAITAMDIIDHYQTDYVLDEATSAKIDINVMDNGHLSYEASYGRKSTEGDAIAAYNKLAEKYKSALGDDYKYKEKTIYGNQIKVMAFVNKNEEQKEAIKIFVEKNKKTGDYEISVTIESSVKARILNE